jgi:hypothetical protein
MIIIKSYTNNNGMCIQLKRALPMESTRITSRTGERRREDIFAPRDNNPPSVNL